MVSRPEEVLEAFSEISGTINNVPYALASFEEQVIVEALGRAGKPLRVDELTEKINLSAATVNQTLSFLLIKSIIKEDGQGYSI